MKLNPLFLSAITGLFMGCTFSLQPGFAMRDRPGQEEPRGAVCIPLNERLRIKDYSEYCVCEEEVCESGKTQELVFSICDKARDQEYTEAHELRSGQTMIKIIRQEERGSKTTLCLETGQCIELSRAIGNICLTYYPDNEKGKFYEDVGSVPILHLKDIGIDPEFQRQGHGTHALEEIFDKLLGLQEKGVLFAPETLVRLEVLYNQPDLIKWYESFGFSLFQLSKSDKTLRMQTHLSQIKFPKYSDRQKAQPAKP